MIQGIFGFQIELSEFAGYGVGGFGVCPMSPEQLRGLLSRHKITVRHHAGDHPALISDSDSLAALDFGEKFSEIWAIFAAVDSIMVSQYMLFAVLQGAPLIAAGPPQGEVSPEFGITIVVPSQKPHSFPGTARNCITASFRPGAVAVNLMAPA
jgi:hypothetical protein